jgi:hypothetical protein
MPMELILNKKVICLPHVPWNFKNIIPKTFVLHYLWFASRIILKQKKCL